MTVLPWEDDPTPPPPDVGPLARTLAALTQATWASGKPEHTTLSKGLTITTYLLDDELHIALTRDGSEPSLDEAETVAQEAGWPGYLHSWRKGRSGTRGLVLVRTNGAPPAPVAQPPPPPGEDPCKAIRRALKALKKGETLTQDGWDKARGQTLDRAPLLQLLLSRPNPSYPPELAEQAREARTSHLKGLSVLELLDEADWFWRHWSAWRLQEFKALENVMTPSFHGTLGATPRSR